MTHQVKIAVNFINLLCLKVNSISFAPHAFGLHLACASSDGKVSILSQVGEEWHSQIISAHSTGCNSVSWAPSAVPSSLFAVNFKALEEKPVPLGSKMIATGGCDNTVKLWKVVEDEAEDGNLNEKWVLEATLEDHTDWVRDVCWRPSLGQVGHMLVSCSQDKTVLIWKLSDETKKWKSKPLKQQPFADTLWRVSFSEYGHLLAVSCGDNTVTIWRENFDDGSWELAGNVNETVTETVKIEEPLAVSPPASAPIPEIQFTSSKTSKIAADVGYMKPMSPMMPAPSLPSANSTPGYQQFDQAYDDYQHAQTPTIPNFSQPLMNSGILASAVIPETSTEKVFSYDQPSAQYKTDGYHPETQQEQQQLNQYAGANEEFNKDIGFMRTTPQYDQSQYDHVEANVEQIVFERPSYEQASYEESTYEGVTFEQPSYEQPYYEQSSYDQANYEQTPYEGATYDQSFYEQPNYQQESYEQSNYEQVNYEQVSHDAQYDSQTQTQYSYDQQITYDQAHQAVYDQSQYETQDLNSNYPEGEKQQLQQETYNSYVPESVVQEQQEQKFDYTLQYEGYNSSASYTADATGF